METKSVSFSSMLLKNLLTTSSWEIDFSGVEQECFCRFSTQVLLKHFPHDVKVCSDVTSLRKPALVTFPPNLSGTVLFLQKTRSLPKANEKI